MSRTAEPQLQDELVIVSTSPRATEEIAARCAAVLRAGDTVTLRGDLGAGKTTFVRGLARGLGFRGRVLSPTYTLAAHYDGDLPIEHLDAYLADKEASFLAEGGVELLGGESVSVVEWPERIEAWLPEERLEIELAVGETEETRMLSVRGRGARGRLLAQGIAAIAEPRDAEGDGR